MWTLRPRVAPCDHLAPRLRRTYLKTRYSVEACEVRVGRRAPAVDATLARHGARCGVLVTAWNPLSRLMPRGWNERMQRQLRERLREVCVLRGDGALGRWREEHLFVLAPAPFVLRLARIFRQNAVVVVVRTQCAALHPVSWARSLQPSTSFPCPAC